MRKIDKLLKYIENQGLKLSSFERKAGLSNSYINNTYKRGEDISTKMLEKMRINLKDEYYKIFPEEKPKQTIQEHDPGNKIKIFEPEESCEKVRIENTFLRQRITDLEEQIKDKVEIIALQRQLLGGNDGNNSKRLG